MSTGRLRLDGESFESIESVIGKTAYLEELQKALKDKTYRAMPVKRVETPKPNGETVRWAFPALKIE